MGEWQTEPLGSCLSDLIDYRGSTPPKSDIGIPVLSAKVVKTSGILYPIDQTISPNNYKKWMRRGYPQPGDVVMTTEGPLGEVIQLNYETAHYALGQRIVCMRGNPRILDNTFLKYRLISPIQKQLLFSFSTGTTVAGISQKALRALPISFPNLATQKRIGATLSALDNKIELNRRMNNTLEAMARTIFKDWFVDFGPTHAKMEGRSPYLASELWDLFPDALDTEEKPIDWTVYALKDLAEHHRATVSPSAEPHRTFEHYSIPAYDSGPEPTLDPGHSIKSNKTVIPHNSVLLSKLNPEIERVWLPNPRGKLSQVTSTEFLAFTPLSPATRTILFCLFKSKPFRSEMISMVTGTSKSHQRVSPKDLLSREVLLADPRLISAFDATVAPLFDRVLANRREIRTLALTRDFLLPKLMSGEIRPDEVGRTVGAVA